MCNAGKITRIIYLNESTIQCYTLNTEVQLIICYHMIIFTYCGVDLLTAQFALSVYARSVIADAVLPHFV